MRFIVLSLFLLSLFLCLSSVVQGQYAGAFLSTDSKNIAKSLFINTTATPSRNPALNGVDANGVKIDQSYTSPKSINAHHMTIEFKPNPLTKFQSFYGDRHNIKVLAFAHDAHGQAILVDFEDNACKSQGGIEIGNEWPHITISTEGKGNYSAVYSNDLIGRLFYSNILKVLKKDSYGKPTRVALVDQRYGEKEWWGTAPEYTAPETPTTPVKTYAPTPVYVKIFPQEGRKVLRLDGTVCFVPGWNDTTVSCPLPKITN